MWLCEGSFRDTALCSLLVYSVLCTPMASVTAEKVKWTQFIELTLACKLEVCFVIKEGPSLLDSSVKDWHGADGSSAMGGGITVDLFAGVK